jgi:hypothetical protein
MLGSSLASAQGKLLVDDFEMGLSPEWTGKSFHGDTLYSIVSDNGGRVLQATSNGTASGLTFARKFDIISHPLLCWRWKVENTIAGGDARDKATDDYAARIYVTFPHWYYPKTTSINYIWANQLPKGHIRPSPYTANSMMFAVESGKKKVGAWIEEKRNLIEDYRQAFGKDPPRDAIISLMTDTDNTESKARAWYDDLFLMSE